MVALKLRQLALAAAVANVASLPLHAREGNEPGLPHDDATTSYCSWWADYDGSQTCKELLDWNWIELEDFRRWNPSIGPDCDGIESGRSYCVEAWDEPGLPAEETATSKTSPTLTTTGKVTTSMIAITSPPSTTVDASNGIKTPDPVHDGIVDNCASFHLVEEGDSCSVIAKKYGVSTANLISWNGLNSGCTNLWSDTYACVSVIGFTPTSTTAKATKTAGNGITTPAPVHEGIASNCNKFHLVEEGDSCAAIAKRYGIRASDIVSWNGLNSGCTNLWGDTYACVSIVGFKPTTTAKTVTTTAAGNGIQTPQPTQPGMVDNCNKFHIIGEKTTCQGIASYNKIELADFFKWNPEVDKGCTNLWLGAYACAGVIGSSPKPTTTKATTTTKPGNGITTPTPTQPGMVNDCNKFHIIGEKTTCQGIADYNRISLVDFFKWNPEVDKACTNLWLGAYACAGVIGSTPKPTTTAKPTVTQPGNGISTPTPIQAGMVSNCNKFHIIGSTTTCQGIIDYNKITMANFKKWNTGINSACSNLWLGSYACVGVIGGTSPAPTTTKPAGGIVTPTPTQAGMIKGCTKFHEVRTTTTCQGILNYNKITLAQFVKWNPAVGKDCSNLWSGTHACVAGP
ncbi:hypothetical protein NW759_015637 [Fusarium solani]|nr:hypothetical protein NW759_015637 [Fusarium solani]